MTASLFELGEMSKEAEEAVENYHTDFTLSRIEFGAAQQVKKTIKRAA